jgi:hypothetical protein
MKGPSNYNRIEILAASALASLMMAVAWSTLASAATPPAAPPILPKAASKAIERQEPKGSEIVAGAEGPVYVPPASVALTANRGLSAAPAVTSAASPSTDANTDTLPIVLASVALLFAVSGIGFTVIASRRMRRSPQPGA